MTSNPERTLRMSKSGLLLCRSVEAIFRAQGFRWDSEESEIYYIAEDTRHEVGFKTMTTKLIYWLVFC